MYYGEIKKTDVANGEGVRVSLFVSGCTRHCKNCFNYETWNFDFGKPFTESVEDEIIEALKPNYIKGFSLLGGEPFEPSNQLGVINLLRKIKATYPNKTIWVYTGNTLETDLLEKNSKYQTEVLQEMLSYIDVLVDGEFIDELRDLKLRFRGSSNQRIIDLPKTLDKCELIHYMK